MKRRLLFIMLLMAGVFPGMSQSLTIGGRVMNDAVPLTGATIEIKKLKKIAVSDTAGYFSIPDIQPGSYLIHISVIGYESFHESIRVSENTHDKVFNLIPITSSLDGVVVTGTMKPVQKKESPILVEVYTPQFLRKLCLRSVNIGYGRFSW